MPRTYKPRKRLYTEASIQVAIEEVNSGASVSMLRKRCLQNKGLVQLGDRGRKTRLSSETGDNWPPTSNLWQNLNLVQQWMS